MIDNALFCGWFDFVNWLQNNLLTCPFKKLTGYDCPGCGFQRSVIALLQGNIITSVLLYPAAIPLVLFGVLSLFGRYFNYNNAYLFARKVIFTLACVLAVVSYLLKAVNYFF